MAARAVAVLVVVGAVGAGGAGPVVAGEPALALDRAQARVGERVTVRLAGWQPGNVMVEVCGNGAVGGSADCAIAASVNAPVGVDGIGQAMVRVTAPPVACPCVIRARALAGGAVRATALRIPGFRGVASRRAPVVRQPTSLAVQDVRLDGGPGAAALLSGPARRTLTMTVRNIGAAPVPQPRLSITTGRPGRTTVVVIAPPVGPLAPGQQRQLRVPVVFGAPAWGRYGIRVEVTGADRPVVAYAHTHSYPWGWLMMCAVLGGVVTRFALRRSGARHHQAGGVPCVVP